HCTWNGREPDPRRGLAGSSRTCAGARDHLLVGTVVALDFPCGPGSSGQQEVRTRHRWPPAWLGWPASLIWRSRLGGDSMRGLVALRVAARIPQRTEAVVMVAGAGYQACDLLRGRYLPRYLVMPATRDSSHRHRARERHLARAGLAAAPDCQECPAALACDGPDAHRP